MDRFDWGRLGVKEVDWDEVVCPFCGRVLLLCVSGEAKRYCSSCNEEFKVRVK